MTYLQFLGFFTVVPIAALVIAVRGRISRRWLVSGAVLCAIALLYTAPWDTAIVLNGVWSYRRGQISGVVIGVIPLEEYLFYLLQVTATVLFVLWLWGRARA